MAKVQIKGIFVSKKYKSQAIIQFIIENVANYPRSIASQVVTQFGVSRVTAKNIFDQYTDDEYRFVHTHIPLRLAQYSNEQLLSRSQARRVLAGIERFSKVVLDFHGIEDIGRAFADEIFRVYQNEHPDIEIMPINTSKEIDTIIHTTKEK